MANSRLQEDSASEQLQLLRNENSALQEDLDDCRARLLAALRDDNQVPDATIKKDFENLRSTIETWIDNNLFEDEMNSDAEDTWERILKYERHGSIMRDLGLYDEVRGSNSRQGSRRNYQANERYRWLMGQPYRNVIVVTSLIWHFLERKIFSLEYPLGTLGNDEKSRPGRDRSHAGLLHDIYEVLKNDRESEDSPLSAERWKSKSVTAMTRSVAFHARENSARDDIYRSLLGQLKKLSPSIVANKGSTQTMDEILGRAIDLQKSMRCSRENYMLWKPDSYEFGPRADLKQWNLRLSDTWRMVAADDDLVPYIGMIPGLYKERRSYSDNSRFELVKPIVIADQGGSRDDAGAAMVPVDGRDMMSVEVERPRKKESSSVRRTIFGYALPRSSTDPAVKSARPNGPSRKNSVPT